MIREFTHACRALGMPLGSRSALSTAAALMAFFYEPNGVAADFQQAPQLAR
jgi:hypothetical protein